MQTPSSSSSSSPSLFYHYDIPSNNMNVSNLYNYNTPTTITMPINTLPQTSQQQFTPTNPTLVDPILTAGFNDSFQTNELGDSFHGRDFFSYVTDLQSATNPAYGMETTMSGSSREFDRAEVPLMTQQNYESSNTVTTDTNLFMTSSPGYFYPPQHQSMAINLGPMAINVPFDNNFIDLYQNSSLPPSSHINTPTSLLHQIYRIYTESTNTENNTLLEAPQQQEVLFPDMLISNTTTPTNYAYKQAIQQQEQFIPSLETPASSPSPQQITQQSQLDIPAIAAALPVEEASKNIKQQIQTTKEKEENETLDLNIVDISSYNFHLQSNAHPQQINDPQPLVQLNRENIVSSSPSPPTTALMDQNNYSSTPPKDHQQQGKNDNIIKNKNKNQQQPVSAINENFTKRIEQEEMQQTTKVYLDPSDTNNTKIKVDPDVLKEIRIKQVLSQDTNFTSSSITAPAPIPLEIFKQIYGKANSATTKIDNCYSNTQSLVSSSSTSSLSLASSASASASLALASTSLSSALPSSGKLEILSRNNNQSSSSRRGKITNTDISKQMPWDITRKINLRKRKHIASSTEPSFLMSRFKTTLASKNKKNKQQGERVFNANSSYNDEERGENEKKVQGHQCPHCPKIISRARDLPRHIVTHIKDYLAFRCERCGRTYRRKDSELRHNKNCS